MATDVRSMDAESYERMVAARERTNELRDMFAMHAPIDIKAALAVWGRDNNLAGPPPDDEARAAFMAVWALLRYEYADAMLAERADAK